MQGGSGHRAAPPPPLPEQLCRLIGQDYDAVLSQYARFQLMHLRAAPERQRHWRQRWSDAGALLGWLQQFVREGVFDDPGAQPHAAARGLPDLAQPACLEDDAAVAVLVAGGAAAEACATAQQHRAAAERAASEALAALRLLQAKEGAERTAMEAEQQEVFMFAQQGLRVSSHSERSPARTEQLQAAPPRGADALACASAADPELLRLHEAAQQARARCAELEFDLTQQCAPATAVQPQQWHDQFRSMLKATPGAAESPSDAAPSQDAGCAAAGEQTAVLAQQLLAAAEARARAAVQIEELEGRPQESASSGSAMQSELQRRLRQLEEEKEAALAAAEARARAAVQIEELEGRLQESASSGSSMQSELQRRLRQLEEEKEAAQGASVCSSAALLGLRRQLQQLSAQRDGEHDAALAAAEACARAAVQIDELEGLLQVAAAASRAAAEPLLRRQGQLQGECSELQCHLRQLEQERDSAREEVQRFRNKLEAQDPQCGAESHALELRESQQRGLLELDAYSGAVQGALALLRAEWAGRAAAEAELAAQRQDQGSQAQAHQIELEAARRQGATVQRQLQAALTEQTRLRRMCHESQQLYHGAQRRAAERSEQVERAAVLLAQDRDRASAERSAAAAALQGEVRALRDQLAGTPQGTSGCPVAAASPPRPSREGAASTPPLTPRGLDEATPRLQVRPLNLQRVLPPPQLPGEHAPCSPSAVQPPAQEELAPDTGRLSLRTPAPLSARSGAAESWQGKAEEYRRAAEEAVRCARIAVRRLKQHETEPAAAARYHTENMLGEAVKELDTVFFSLVGLSRSHPCVFKLLSVTDAGAALRNDVKLLARVCPDAADTAVDPRRLQEELNKYIPDPTAGGPTEPQRGDGAKEG